MTPGNKSPGLFDSRLTFRVALRIALIYAVYLLLFSALDLNSHSLQVYPSVVAWYPPDGLSFALLLTFGAAFLPGFVIASLISSFFVFKIPASFLSLLGWALFLPLTYGLAAWFLRQRVHINTQLRGARDLIWMIAAASVAVTILAWTSVLISAAAGLIPQAEVFWASFQWWIGEMIGVLVVTPALLIYVMPYVKRFAGGETRFDQQPFTFKRPTLLIFLQVLSILFAIYLAVGVNWPNKFHPYFLIGFPLVWIAIEHGLPGSTLGNVLANFGIIWAIQWHQHFELTELGGLQAMMLVITMTSLMIGVIVSDHRKSEQSPTPEIERRRKMITYEWIIVAVLAMSTWVLEYTYNFLRVLTDWETRKQIEGVHETLATILVIGAASAVFSLRRWREFQVELKQREKAQTELRALTNDLEAKVQERTADLSRANSLLQAEIIERKQVEGALGESENRFRALFSTSPDAILLFDHYSSETSWPIVDCNQAACRMNGYSREELIGQSVNMLNIEDGTDEERAAYLARLRREGSIQIEAFHRHKDGHIFSVEVSTSLFVFEGRELVLGIDRDNTEQKQAKEAIERSERRFRALVENSMEEVSLVGMDGRLIFESPSTRRPLGYPPDLFVGNTLTELFHPDDWANATNLLEQISREPSGYREAIFRLKHMDGSWRWMEGRMTNLLHDPAVGAVVINYRDITERKLAEDEIQTRAHELLMLYELSSVLAGASGLDAILELVNRRAVESVHATFARIALLEGDDFVMRSAYPIRILDHDLLLNHRTAITAMPYCQQVMEQDEPVLLRASDEGISKEERAALLLDFAQVVSVIPLRVHEFSTNSSRILGLLMIGETRMEEREPFTAEKMRLARSIGNQAAVAIDKARLFTDLRRSNFDLNLAYDATISGWSAALDLRDKETEGHSQRVTEMTLRLAKRMGFSEQELVHVRRGALLHDTGKMGVPDSILLKPDKLTGEEWEIMRMHPAYAYKMLKPISYLATALDIPYCHHEKWDGTGYPQGLKGEAIPLSARVFAIVDVYDALTSDRPYRKGWPREKTVDYIREQSGTHFDPQVVDVFLKMIVEEK